MKKLNLGCGKTKLPGFVNVDLDPEVQPDLVDDATKLETIEDESANLIYASHLLDHVSRRDVPEVLQLWWHKLQPGGTLRLAVSDFAAIAIEYKDGRPLEELLGLLVGGHKSPWDRHGTAFDKRTLHRDLQAAGFEHIREWDWRKTEHADHDDFSQAYLPHLDKENGRLMSLNLEASRPSLPRAEDLSGPDAHQRQFYLGQIEKWGLDERSSVPDRYIRDQETKAILDVLDQLIAWSDPGVFHHKSRILEVGCGNGALLSRLRDRGFSDVIAVDYLPEFVKLAESRGTGYIVQQGDVRYLAFPPGRFDVVISERCVINVLSPDGQAQAFRQLRRVLAPRGHLILVEAFADAWRNLNAARAEFGLEPHPMAAHNRWIEEDELEAAMEGMARVEAIFRRLTPRHFLSSYFYASRVLHDVLLKAAGIKRGVVPEHFAQLMGEVLPPAGEYANIQFLVYRKP